MGRRKGRELALQMLYQWDLRQSTVMSVLETFWKVKTAEPLDQHFAESLFRGVVTKLEELDTRIEQHALRWRVARMPVVDRNILRLGTYELLHVAGVPTLVTLNEAIELAKRYASRESASYVNGVLDKVAKTIGDTKPHYDEEELEEGEYLSSDDD